MIKTIIIGSSRGVLEDVRAGVHSEETIETCNPITDRDNFSRTLSSIRDNGASPLLIVTDYNIGSDVGKVIAMALTATAEAPSCLVVRGVPSKNMEPLALMVEKACESLKIAPVSPETLNAGVILEDEPAKIIAIANDFLAKNKTAPVVAQKKGLGAVFGKIFGKKGPTNG